MSKNRKRIILSIISIVAIVFLAYQTIFNRRGTYSTTNYYLDTINQISLIDVKERDSKKLLEGVDKITLDINNEMSMQLNSSELSNINKNAGIKPVRVSKDMMEIVKKSIYYSKISSDNFDVSIGPISSMWGIGSEKARVPDKIEIEEKLPLVDYKNIEIDAKNNTVFLKKKDMMIDLGGIAKGFCADKITDYLKSNGVKNAIINLGGNVFVYGKNARGKDFNVGIQNPQKNSQEPIAEVTLTGKSIVTSGIYERFIEKDGKFYHHMLSPKTGYPFENELSSVTIISNKSVDGDALSTSTYGMGLEKGLKFIQSQDGIDAIFVTKDKKIYITQGIKNSFKITNNSYKLIDKD